MSDAFALFLNGWLSVLLCLFAVIVFFVFLGITAKVWMRLRGQYDRERYNRAVKKFLEDTNEK